MRPARCVCVSNVERGCMEEKDILEINIYDFMNSAAISRHCRDTGHQFTPLETAYLINSSQKHTLTEKQQAFRWVIEHMPDDELRLSRAVTKDNRSGKVSLAWFLEKYMALQNKCLDEFFMADEESVYQMCIYNSLPEFYQQAGKRKGKYYKSVKAALSDIKEDFIHGDSGETIHIYKVFFNEGQRCISILFNSNGEVTDIYHDSGLSYEEMDIMEGFALSFSCLLIKLRQ